MAITRQMLNTEHIEGRVYEHDLAIKTSNSEKTKGIVYIAGNLSVATDEEGLNVIQVHFTFVTETTSKGKKNMTFANLKKIIDEGKTWVTDGKDAAIKVKIDTNLALNDFYNKDGELVSAKKNEGGFVTLVSELCPEAERNVFKVDMLINHVTHVEANPEKNIDKDYAVVRGAVFGFGKGGTSTLLPVDFTIRSQEGMNYFEGLDASPKNLIFTKVWGQINSTTTVVERREESAFGEAAVRTFERKTKEWTITGANVEPYDFGSEEVLTSEQVEEAMQARNIYLAEIKERQDEYRKSQANKQSFSSTGSMNAPTGGFDF